MLNRILLGLVLVSLILGGCIFYFSQTQEYTPEVACTMDARMCPDGSYVGRTGPACEFEACPLSENEGVIPVDIQTHIASKADLIRVATPAPGTLVTTPLTISGEARGTWFFEASFPITVVDWDGLIIGEGYATADGDWMTEEFVPFTAIINFTIPSDTPYRRGAIILKKDNPSGLPEYENALEIPVNF